MEELKEREAEGGGEIEEQREGESDGNREAAEIEETRDEESEEKQKEITHRYHLQHPLTLTLLNTESETNNLIQTQSPLIFDRCGWCEHKPFTWVYSCSICSFCLCLSCSRKKPLLTITNPKSHHHSLFFLPRPLLHPCDACGLIIARETSYACFQCNYMVHESCIDLPRVIKLTRHPHRLVLTPYLPPAVLSCRVCYEEVDTRFGQYSCNHEDCSYVIHSKCATHENVWDGRDLEGEPEDTGESEDVASFKKVGDDLIEYFGHHHHHLKLEKNDGNTRGVENQCVACIRPIEFDCFYRCVECSYYLHEVCAGLPRKLAHLLHKHPLVLDPFPLEDSDYMTCTTCSRKSSGFRYKCAEPYNCSTKFCNIDLQCISLPHYFTHKSHSHPLFTTVSYGLGFMSCVICKIRCARAMILCILVDYALCFRCATIPSELHYKFDKHPLSLCYGESDDVGIYWCEVCEEQMNGRKWFYTCDECCTTIHHECIFGSFIYLKPRSKFYLHGYQVEIIPNNIGGQREICHSCWRRCRESVFLRGEGYKSFCSFVCLPWEIRYYA